MSKELEEFNIIKLDFKGELKKIGMEEKKFPKYTTQIINLANQNAQATRPKVVGQLSELIQQCPEKSYKGWRRWYLKHYPDAIEKATKKIAKMIKKMKAAMDLIDEEMIREWVEDLVLTKTAQGLIIQEIILKTLADSTGHGWRLATPREESKNIDGFIGSIPVSIKSVTYKSKKPTVREEIDVEMIFYKKTDKYLYIYHKLDLD
jgi:hypothetical protein